ncbi:MAG: PfkB family carbohydrate kinase [Haloarculaceae archaeon]
MTGAPDEPTVAAAREAAAELPERIEGDRMVFGFDGYLDRVREVVADRQDAGSYEALATLAGFSERVADSVETGSSLTFEWLQDGSRTGGHTCHLGRAFGKWGFEPVLVGTYGDPVREQFAAEFGDYELHTLGAPGVTDAVEFDDGKLMLSEIGDQMDLDWATVTEGVGRDLLVDRLDGAALLGTGYWSEVPALPDVYEGLRDLWPEVESPPEHLLIDTGDVRKLDPENIAAGRAAISRLEEVADVVVSANRAETRLLAETVAGADPDADPAAHARAVREELDVTMVAGHGVDRSVVATADGTVGVDVPTVSDPELTTSSGDHFNAGLALGLVEGLAPAPAVVVGNAVAGLFVRSGQPPSLDEVREFVGQYADAF